MPPPRLHADEVDIDDELTRRLVAGQLPAYKRLPLRRVASGGTDNAVFRLGDDLAVRLPRHPGAVSGLLKEARWLPVVAPNVSLDVPEVVALGDPDDGYPFPWAVVRWLTGEDALTGRFQSMDDTAAALGRFVTELRRIADVPAPGSTGFVRGQPLVGRDATVRASLAQCEGLIDVHRVAEIWDDARRSALGGPARLAARRPASRQPARARRPPRRRARLRCDGHRRPGVRRHSGLGSVRAVQPAGVPRDRGSRR